MNDSDKASEIAERVLLLDSQIEGLKEWILTRHYALNREQLDRELFALDSKVRLDPTFRERYDVLKTAIQLQDDPSKMLHLLYQHLLYGGASVS